MGEGQSKPRDALSDKPSVAAGNIKQEEYTSLRQRCAPRGLHIDHDAKVHNAPSRPAAAPMPVQQTQPMAAYAPQGQATSVSLPMGGMLPRSDSRVRIATGAMPRSNSMVRLPGSALPRSNSMVRIGAVIPRSDSMVRMSNGAPITAGSAVIPTGAVPSMVPAAMQRCSSMVRTSAQHEAMFAPTAPGGYPAVAPPAMNVMPTMQRGQVVYQMQQVPTQAMPTLQRSSSMVRTSGAADVASLKVSMPMASPLREINMPQAPVAGGGGYYVPFKSHAPMQAGENRYPVYLPQEPKVIPGSPYLASARIPLGSARR